MRDRRVRVTYERRSARDGSREGGYTLLEILVSVGILVMLGAGLVTLMTQGMSIWRRAENRGRVYEQARVLLDQIAEDLRSVVTAASDGADSSWVRFICDTDPEGRQRLRFVRTISGESADPILRSGGQYLSARTPATYDGSYDAWEAREGSLGAPGGLMEIFYACDPREESRLLWRGFRSPLGGPRSLFVDRNIEDGGSAGRGSSGRRSSSRGGAVPKLAPTKKKEDSTSSSEKEEEIKDPDEVSVEEVAFADVAKPLTDGVLYLGFSFWGPTTNTWDLSEIPLARPKGSELSGPLILWDSTRALLDDKGKSGEFYFSAREGSLTNPNDDIFPERVEVTIVLRDDDRDPVVLRRPINGDATTLILSRDIVVPEALADRYIRVGSEWMTVNSVDGRTVEIEKDGRGVRGTEARKHGAGAVVDVGATFRRVIDLPGSRRPRTQSSSASSSKLAPKRGNSSRARSGR